MFRGASREGSEGRASVMEVRRAVMRELVEAMRAVVSGARVSAALCRIERVVERQWLVGSSEPACVVLAGAISVHVQAGCCLT